MPKQELQVDWKPDPTVLAGGDTKTLHFFPYRCFGEQVLVKRIEDETDHTTKSGVVKPEIARQKSNRGVIMALGEGRILGDRIVPFNLKPGDFVRFSRVGGTDLEVDGEMFILLHWKQVFLVETA